MKGGHGFHQNQLGQLFADGEAGVANLADEIVSAGDEPDDLVFAEPDFPEAVLNFRRGAKLLDAHRDAGLDAAQGTHFTVGFLSQPGGCRVDVHGRSFA